MLCCVRAARVGFAAVFALPATILLCFRYFYISADVRFDIGNGDATASVLDLFTFPSSATAGDAYGPFPPYRRQHVAIRRKRIQNLFANQEGAEAVLNLAWDVHATAMQTFSTVASCRPAEQHVLRFWNLDRRAYDWDVAESQRGGAEDLRAKVFRNEYAGLENGLQHVDRAAIFEGFDKIGQTATGIKLTYLVEDNVPGVVTSKEEGEVSIFDVERTWLARMRTGADLHAEAFELSFFSEPASIPVAIFDDLRVKLRTLLIAELCAVAAATLAWWAACNRNCPASATLPLFATKIMIWRAEKYKGVCAETFIAQIVLPTAVAAASACYLHLFILACNVDSSDIRGWLPAFDDDMTTVLGFYLFGLLPVLLSISVTRPEKVSEERDRATTRLTLGLLLTVLGCSVAAWRMHSGSGDSNMAYTEFLLGVYALVFVGIAALTRAALVRTGDGDGQVDDTKRPHMVGGGIEPTAAAPAESDAQVAAVGETTPRNAAAEKHPTRSRSAGETKGDAHNLKSSADDDQSTVYDDVDLVDETPNDEDTSCPPSSEKMKATKPGNREAPREDEFCPMFDVAVIPADERRASALPETNTASNNDRETSTSTRRAWWSFAAEDRALTFACFAMSAFALCSAVLFVADSWDYEAQTKEYADNWSRQTPHADEQNRSRASNRPPWSLPFHVAHDLDEKGRLPNADVFAPENADGFGRDGSSSSVDFWLAYDHAATDPVTHANTFERHEREVRAILESQPLQIQGWAAAEKLSLVLHPYVGATNFFAGRRASQSFCMEQVLTTFLALLAVVAAGGMLRAVCFVGSVCHSPSVRVEGEFADKASGTTGAGLAGGADTKDSHVGPLRTDDPFVLYEKKMRQKIQHELRKKATELRIINERLQAIRIATTVGSVSGNLFGFLLTVLDVLAALYWFGESVHPLLVPFALPGMVVAGASGADKRLHINGLAVLWCCAFTAIFADTTGLLLLAFPISRMKSDWINEKLARPGRGMGELQSC
eukprot:g18846.t1